MSRSADLATGQSVEIATAAQAADNVEATTDIANRGTSTASVLCVPNPRGDAVYGPAVSVDGDIVLFDGVAGTLIKDSGVAGAALVLLTDAELLALASLVSAADSLPYFTGAGTASLTILSAFVRTILDDADAAAVRTTIDAAATDHVHSATTVETDIGSTGMFAGKFTVTDASISSTSKVLCWQAPGPYTGKGTLADEAEMQPVMVISVEPATGSAIVKWQTPPMVIEVSEVSDGRVNISTQPSQLSWASARAQRRGLVRGNIKFSYMVLA